MIEAFLALPAHLRRRLSDSLASGLVTPPYTEASLRSALGAGENAAAAGELLVHLEHAGLVGVAAACWTRAVDEAASFATSPDLVWSGPEVSGLHARDTRRVYEELLGSANRSIWLSTFAYFDGPRAFEVLAARMSSVPTLRVTLLLNIQRRRGDSTAAEQLVRNFADRFWKVDWPGAVRPRVYYDPRSLDLEGRGGVLHAKAVVVDEEDVFVTSANLTEAALDRNIEVGLVVRDRVLAGTLAAHFSGLIDRNLLNLLPSAVEESGFGRGIRNQRVIASCRDSAQAWGGAASPQPTRLRHGAKMMGPPVRHTSESEHPPGTPTSPPAR